MQYLRIVHAYMYTCTCTRTHKLPRAVQPSARSPHTSLCTCRIAAIHVIANLSECAIDVIRTCRYAAIHVIAYLSECGYTRYCVLVGLRL